MEAKQGHAGPVKCLFLPVSFLVISHKRRRALRWSHRLIFHLSECTTKVDGFIGTIGFLIRGRVYPSSKITLFSGKLWLWLCLVLSPFSDRSKSVLSLPAYKGTVVFAFRCPIDLSFSPLFHKKKNSWSIYLIRWAPSFCRKLATSGQNQWEKINNMGFFVCLFVCWKDIYPCIPLVNHQKIRTNIDLR